MEGLDLVHDVLDGAHLGGGQRSRQGAGSGSGATFLVGSPWRSRPAGACAAIQENSAEARARWLLTVVGAIGAGRAVAADVAGDGQIEVALHPRGEAVVGRIEAFGKPDLFREVISA
ncbi:hypothetical protein AB0C18_28905 [Nonomuraea muscovyensis]|uniref:hypothetical protein n=1 Tax=Nonomuraea muscovyensis TaxID=1124761 RepID=UPI0033D8CA83